MILCTTLGVSRCCNVNDVLLLSWSSGCAVYYVRGESAHYTTLCALSSFGLYLHRIFDGMCEVYYTLGSHCLQLYVYNILLRECQVCCLLLGPCLFLDCTVYCVYHAL